MFASPWWDIIMTVFHIYIIVLYDTLFPHLYKLSLKAVTSK